MSTRIALSRYRKGKLLGHGAFGKVYLYESLDECEHSNIAVKKAKKNADEHLTDDLKCQEIEVLSKLEHRNIVRYLGHQEGKSLLIILEYMPGGSIEDQLKSGAFTENTTRRYTQDILKGLHYLHSRNIIHRDVKGGNILLSSRDTAKLADFGIAKELRRSTVTSGGNSPKGTIKFMAPEVVMSGEDKPRYGRKSDIWSVGCVVVQMLTTHPPWKKYKEQHEIIGAIIFATDEKQVVYKDLPQYELPAEVSDEARKFVQDCFIRIPDDRPTAQELLRYKLLQLVLEFPEANADGVVEATKLLNRQLRTDLMENSLKEATEYLYVATNATAKDADQQIKVKSCLSNAMRLCDAWSLMQGSFEVGASDILEKLHSAYVKFFDGFLDLALADVEAVNRHVRFIRTECKTTEGSFETIIRELEGTVGFLEEEEKKNGSTRNIYRDEYHNKTDELEAKIKAKMMTNDLEVVANDRILKILELELEAPRDNYHGVFKKIENGRLAKAALTLALQKLNDGLEFLVTVKQLIDKWYNECKEVVQKSMRANVTQAGKLSEAKQKEFWKPLAFVKTAYNFLCRWKALQQICLSTSSHMRRVRGDIDWYYTENLCPSEAVEKAWVHRDKNEELKKKVPQRKQNNVVPDHDCMLQKLFQIPVKVEGTQFGDPSNSCGYRQQLEIIGSYSWCLCHIREVPVILTAKKRTNIVCTDLLVCAQRLRTESVAEFASGYIGCKHALDDIPRAKNESSGNDRIEEIVSKLSDSVKSLNESDLKSAEDHFNTQVTDGWRQLKEDIKTEECTAVMEEAKEDSSIGGRISNFGSEITRFARRQIGLLPNQKKSDAVADSIKKYQLAVDIIQEIQKQLPLDDIKEIYSELFDNLKTMGSNMRKELCEVVGENCESSVQERCLAWQHGVFSNLIGFIELFSTSSREVQNLHNLIHSSKINDQIIVGISWKEMKQLVATDQYLCSKALATDGKVDNKVTEKRGRLKRNKYEEQEGRRKREELKRKAVGESQSKAEVERKRKVEEARKTKTEPDKKRRRKERKRKASDEDNVLYTESGEMRDGALRGETDSLDPQNLLVHNAGCNYMKTCPVQEIAKRNQATFPFSKLNWKL